MTSDDEGAADAGRGPRAEPAETPNATADEVPGSGALTRVLRIHRGEGRIVLLAATYHFFLMASYFILKPLREEMGVLSGARNLKFLWLGTLVTSLAVLPPYWKLVARLPRRRLIPIANRGVLVTLVVFFSLLQWMPRQRVVWAARAFYVWVSVFNLFVLSVFWSFMADAFNATQGRRLFGLIAAGGTAGALLGAKLTATFAKELQATGLILVSAALLEFATQCALAFGRRLDPALSNSIREPDGKLRPSLREQWIAGFRLLGRSPYLLGVTSYLFLSTFASSIAYAQRTEIMGAQIKDTATRTAIFGWSEFATQGLAFLGQTLLSARLLARFGTGFTLATQMVVAAAGFAILGTSFGHPQALVGFPSSLVPLENPSGPLAAIVLFFVLLKATEFALSKPTREALFTVVTRDEKYQSKSLIDTGLYRAFDQVHIWSISTLREVGWSLARCAYAAAPVVLVGIWLSAWLGRKQSELATAKRRAQLADDVLPTSVRQ